MNTSLTKHFHYISQFLADDVPLELAEVKGGTLLMLYPGQEKERFIPKIRLNDFYIGKYPVTNLQYSAFLNSYGSQKVKDWEVEKEKLIYEHKLGIQLIDNSWKPAVGYEDHPVINITWNGAVEFCSWLSENSDYKYRLPNEAEWEFAARGGKEVSILQYSGSMKLKQVGWYNLNSHGETNRVNLKLPNELGLYCMSGNVKEWCSDYWEKNEKRAKYNKGAWFDYTKKERRVIRGGSWNDDDFACLVSNRTGNDAYSWFDNVGFRVVR